MNLNEEVRRLMNKVKMLLEENKGLKEKIGELESGNTQVSSQTEERAKLLQT